MSEQPVHQDQTGQPEHSVQPDTSAQQPTTGQSSLPAPYFHCDAYQTPAPAAVGLWPALRFYPRLLGVVLRAAAKARRGDYQGSDWAASSEEVARLLEGVGCRFQIEGLDRVRQMDGPCVVVGNHMSTLETFVLPALIQPWRDCTFVIKSSLLKYPFFKHVVGSRDPIVVGRANPREDLTLVLREGAARLARGMSIIIFPQSTRNATFCPAQFNSIGVKLAKRAGVPLIPLALKTDAWSNGHLIKDFGPIYPERTIHFRFGQPRMVEGTGKEAHQDVVTFVQDNLEVWQK